MGTTHLEWSLCGEGETARNDACRGVVFGAGANASEGVDVNVERYWCVVVVLRVGVLVFNRIVVIE